MLQRPQVVLVVAQIPGEARDAAESVAPTNLPLPVTSFHNRDRERELIRELIAERRLVT